MVGLKIMSRDDFVELLKEERYNQPKKYARLMSFFGQVEALEAQNKELRSDKAKLQEDIKAHRFTIDQLKDRLASVYIESSIGGLRGF